MKRRALIAAFLAAPLLGTACGPKKTTIEGSLAETYVNLEELAEAADVIAEARVLSTTVDRSDGIPWTISSVVIEKIMKGEISEKITLRQTGTVNEIAEGLSPAVEEGRRYVMYLVPYVINDAQTGEYIPVTVGVMEIEGEVAVVPETAEELEEFPETVKLSEVEEVAEESSAPGEE